MLNLKISKTPLKGRIFAILETIFLVILSSLLVGCGDNPQTNVFAQQEKKIIKTKLNSFQFCGSLQEIDLYLGAIDWTRPNETSGVQEEIISYLNEIISHLNEQNEVAYLESDTERIASVQKAISQLRAEYQVRSDVVRNILDSWCTDNSEQTGNFGDENWTSSDYVSVLKVKGSRFYKDPSSALSFNASNYGIVGVFLNNKYDCGIWVFNNMSNFQKFVQEIATPAGFYFYADIRNDSHNNIFAATAGVYSTSCIIDWSDLFS